MESPPTTPEKFISLEQLLKRGDVWRGHSQRFIPQPVLDSGYPDLNAALASKGWPLGTLIEVCEGFCQNEWLLFAPAIANTGNGFVVLLNPPALPLPQGLFASGIDLDRLIVIETSDEAEFVTSYIELTRAKACDAVLAWQPPEGLNYTQLRKILLSCAEGEGMYTIFRPDVAQQQASPATLRLTAVVNLYNLEISIFKQKGMLETRDQRVTIPLPDSWNQLLPFNQLHLPQGMLESQRNRSASGYRATSTVTPFQRGKK